MVHLSHGRVEHDQDLEKKPAKQQFIMQMFDAPLDGIDQDAFDIVWDAFSTFGDSLIIENTNNMLRRITMGQMSDVSACVADCDRALRHDPTHVKARVRPFPNEK